MGEFACSTFISKNILTKNDEDCTEKIIRLIEEEEGLQANGIQCDDRISETPEQQKEILGIARQLCKNNELSSTEALKEEAHYIHSR